MLANIPEGENTTDNICTYMDYIEKMYPRVQQDDGSFDPSVE